MTLSTNPYTSQSISGYNSDPPPDDGTTGSDNLVTWAKHKTKLADPIKTLSEAINTQLTTAFSKTINADAGVRNQLNSSVAFAWATATIGNSIIAPSYSSAYLNGATTDTVFEIQTGSVYDGAILTLKTATSDDVVTLIHATATGAATATAANIYFANQTNQTLSSQYDVVSLRYDSTASGWVDAYSNSGVSGAITPGGIKGLTLSNGTDSDHDIDVAAGVCRDFDNTTNITISAITKQIDAPFATGSGAGGLATVATATNDTWYHVHALDIAGGEIGFDTSASATNFRTDNGVTAYRRIGSVLTDSSANIVAFYQFGDDFIWDAASEDYNADPGTAEITTQLTVPTDVEVFAQITGSGKASTTAAAYYHSVYYPGITTPSASSHRSFTFSLPAGSGQGEAGSTFMVRTNTSGQVQHIASSSLISSIVLQTVGWRDDRGKNG